MEIAVKGWWGYGLAFILGAALCGGIVLYLAHGSGAKLNAELAAAGDSVQSLRTDLADASAANHQLADQLSKLQVQLNKSSLLLASDDAVIAKQQLTIAAGQRLADSIASNLAGAGNDLGKQIDAIADGFVKLYNLYGPHQVGSKKGPG